MNNINEIKDEKMVSKMLNSLHGVDIPEPPPEIQQEPTWPAIWDLVQEDFKKRDELGFKNYGTRLRPFNGRSALWDAYHEELDKVAYMRQFIFEQERTMDPELIDLLRWFDGRTPEELQDMKDYLLTKKGLKNELKSE